MIEPNLEPSVLSGSPRTTGLKRKNWSEAMRVKVIYGFVNVSKESTVRIQRGQVGEVLGENGETLLVKFGEVIVKTHRKFVRNI